MMMGPTKKKILTTGIVAFTVPVVIGGVIFWQYGKKKNEEIANLKVKSEVTRAYVFTDNLLEGDVIAASDIKLVDAKGESAPIDSFSGDKSEIVGRRVRINAEAKTIVTESMLMDEVNKQPTISERYQEFNSFVLPSDLDVGDYVDLRITMPDGENYIIVAGKEVKSLGTTPDNNTIFLQLDEEEIVRTTSAIIEAYMGSGIKLYVTKYIDPSAQLYKSERINFVERFENTLNSLYETRLALVSGDNANILEYIRLYGGTIEEQNALREKLSGDPDMEITVSKDDITNSEIAPYIGLTEKQTGDIRDAIAKSDDSVLCLYNDKLVRTRLDMKETYPIKGNVLTAILNNPNILEELSAKYNIEELKRQREALQDYKAYKYDEFAGEYIPTESLNNLQTNLDKEIETQINERKAYLQELLLSDY